MHLWHRLYNEVLQINRAIIGFYLSADEASQILFSGFKQVRADAKKGKEGILENDQFKTS